MKRIYWTLIVFVFVGCCSQQKQQYRDLAYQPDDIKELFNTEPKSCRGWVFEHDGQYYAILWPHSLPGTTVPLKIRLDLSLMDERKRSSSLDYMDKNIGKIIYFHGYFARVIPKNNPVDAHIFMRLFAVTDTVLAL